MKTHILAIFSWLIIFASCSIQIESDDDFKEWIKDCNSGDSSRCKVVGLVYLGYSHITKYAYYLNKACDLGDMLSCGALGEAYEYGRFVKQSYAKSAIYYSKVCNSEKQTEGHVDICNKLGFYYSQGLGVRQSYTKAVEFFRKGCNENSANSCNNLGVAYNNGQGVRQNKTIAKELFGTACDLGSDKGCENYVSSNK